MIARLRDAGARARIKRDFAEGLPGWQNQQRAAGWDGIVIAACAGRPELEGRRADELGADPADAVLDLIAEQRGRVTMIAHLMREDDVDRVIAHPASMIGSDAIPQAGRPHPRLAGTFARILGRYVRERGLLDLQTAVRKMTALPAARFGLRDRGILAVGAVADDAQPGTDVAALRDGKISVTPIALDLTSHELLEELARFDWGWTAPVAITAEAAG